MLKLYIKPVTTLILRNNSISTIITSQATKIDIMVFEELLERPSSLKGLVFAELL